jgi:hypothetical protein
MEKLTGKPSFGRSIRKWEYYIEMVIKKTFHNVKVIQMAAYRIRLCIRGDETSDFNTEEILKCSYISYKIPLSLS